LQPCCGKTWQSKRQLSILIVQSRISGNLLSSFFIYFGEGLSVCIALKALVCSGDDASPQHLSVLKAIHTLNSPKNYIRLFGGLLTIHLMQWIEAQGLMWGTRGLFPLVAAMVCFGCVG
jgi:hypothetical protein